MIQTLTQEEVNRKSLQLRAALHKLEDENQKTKDPDKGLRKSLAVVRSGFKWFLGQGENITAVVEVIPMAAPYAPLVKVIFAIALLPTVSTFPRNSHSTEVLTSGSKTGKEAREACDKARKHLCDTYDIIFASAETSPFNTKMDEIFLKLEQYIEAHLPENKSNTRIGLKNKDTVAFVTEILDQIKVARDNEILRLTALLPGIVSSRTHSTFLPRLAEDCYYTQKLGIEDLQGRILPPTPLEASEEPFPVPPSLFGRDDDLSKVLGLLQKPNDAGFKEHVALLGLGGIGKTSLATLVGHRVQDNFGRRSFIRCERASNLEEFQRELLPHLRTAEGPTRKEDLGHLILTALAKERRFLVLDNLFDTEIPEGCLDFLSQLSDVGTATLFITSRNAELCSQPSASRETHQYRVAALGLQDSERLFRRVFSRGGDGDFALNDANKDTLQTLLQLLDGIPLAINLIAAYARSQLSLEDVVQQWKKGDEWNEGPQDRRRSLQFSLDLSFNDSALRVPATIAFLRLLATLPHPIPRARAPSNGPIGAAMKALRKTSIGEVGKVGGFIKLLEPVRQYILHRCFEDFDADSDANKDVVRTLAISYFNTVIEGKGSAEDHDNWSVFITLTEGMFGNGIEAARVGALLSDQYGDKDLVSHLKKLLEIQIEDTAELQFSISDYVELVLYVFCIRHLRDILEFESGYCLVGPTAKSEYWLGEPEVESGSEIAADSDHVGKLHKSQDTAEVATSRLKGTRLLQLLTSYFPATTLPFVIKLLTPETQTQALEAALEQAKRYKLNISTAQILNVMGEMARRVDKGFLDYLFNDFFVPYIPEHKPNGSVQASNYFREAGDYWCLNGNQRKAAQAYGEAAQCMPKDTKESIAAWEYSCTLSAEIYSEQGAFTFAEDNFKCAAKIYHAGGNVDEAQKALQRAAECAEQYEKWVKFPA
ncbi:hypothetical protein P7C70_g8216, partial [Phenoliferia sp. Uapishka_3]